MGMVIDQIIENQKPSSQQGATSQALGSLESKKLWPLMAQHGGLQAAAPAG